MPESRPNILVICTDQQSADAMSCAGNDALHTPAMDRIARRGTRFNRAYCPQPLCGPCRASLFCGRMPHEVGATYNGFGIDERFRDREIGTMFQAAGYSAAYAGKWHVPESSMPVDNDHGFESLCPHNDHMVPDACINFLHREHDRPFLLFACFDNPHNICQYARNEPLPWGEIEEVPLEECPNLPANFAIPPHEPQVIRIMAEGNRRIWPSVDYTIDQYRRLRHGYYRMCEKVDAQIGQILDALDSTGQAQNTIIIFMSDHGDMAGAHHLNQKTVLYEESVGVPMIVSTPWDAGDRVDGHLVNIGLDLMPTLLDYAGIDAPDDLRGHSLRGVTAGETPADWRTEVVAETTWQPVAALGNAHSYGRMLRTDRYKYIVYAFGQQREQLFDMVNDPGEMVDLTVEARYADVLNDHRARLAEICRETGDDFRVPEVGRLVR